MKIQGNSINMSCDVEYKHVKAWLKEIYGGASVQIEV
jgi:copper chaperone CopZ